MKLVLNVKVISIFIFLFLLIFTLLYFLNYVSENQHVYVKNHVERGRQLSKSIPEEPAIVIKERIVHIDLKGAPLKISYYSQLFPLLKRLGATGVLIEYEDMFPYNGSMLRNISALNAYSLDDIKVINDLGNKHKLKVIPFLQMFGRLDYVLKLEEFVNYREVWNLPSTPCPTYTKTIVLLEEMVRQVVEAHPESKHIHIGCGEVAHLGHCQRCTNQMSEEKLTKSGLFLKHLHTVVRVIKRRFPHLEILAWDDHFRNLPLEEIDETTSNNYLFKPVVWWYGKDVYDELGPSLWQTYARAFSRVWVASAYKGAIGTNKYISDVSQYLQNHNSWLSVIGEYQGKIVFEGIILTGIQRYDHFSVLCELLPVGIPALAMSLRLLQGFRNSALGPPVEVAKALECEQPYALIGSAFGSPKCKFPGASILENIIHFHQLVQEFEEMTDDSRVKGWLSDYNINNSFSNPRQVKSVLLPLDKIKNDLDSLKSELSSSMLDVYDEYTVNEWLVTYLLPLQKKVLSLWEAKQEILEKVHWPRKPFNFNNKEL